MQCNRIITIEEENNGRNVVDSGDLFFSQAFLIGPAKQMIARIAQFARQTINEPHLATTAQPLESQGKAAKKKRVEVISLTGSGFDAGYSRGFPGWYNYQLYPWLWWFIGQNISRNCYINIIQILYYGEICFDTYPLVFCLIHEALSRKILCLSITG